MVKRKRALEFAIDGTFLSRTIVNVELIGSGPHWDLAEIKIDPTQTELII